MGLAGRVISELNAPDISNVSVQHTPSESPLHFPVHAERAWIALTFRGSPAGGVTARSGDLDAVGVGR